MNFAEFIGTFGVTMLLVGWTGLLTEYIKAYSLTYLSLGILGAALCCWSSYLIGFIPFIVLNFLYALFGIYVVIQKIIEVIHDREKTTKPRRN